MVANKEGEKILEQDDYLIKHLFLSSNQEENSEILDKINNNSN